MFLPVHILISHHSLNWFSRVFQVFHHKPEVITALGRVKHSVIRRMLRVFTVSLRGWWETLPAILTLFFYDSAVLLQRGWQNGVVANCGGLIFVKILSSIVPVEFFLWQSWRNWRDKLAHNVSTVIRDKAALSLNACQLGHPTAILAMIKPLSPH